MGLCAPEFNALIFRQLFQLKFVYKTILKTKSTYFNLNITVTCEQIQTNRWFCFDGMFIINFVIAIASAFPVRTPFINCWPNLLNGQTPLCVRSSFVHLSLTVYSTFALHLCLKVERFRGCIRGMRWFK